MRRALARVTMSFGIILDDRRCNTYVRFFCSASRVTVRVGAPKLTRAAPVAAGKGSISRRPRPSRARRSKLAVRAHLLP